MRKAKKDIWQNSKEENSVGGGDEAYNKSAANDPKRETSTKSAIPVVSVGSAFKNESKENKASLAAKTLAKKAGVGKCVKPFVDATLKKGVMGLIAEFRKMKRVNDFSKMSEFVLQNPQGRNRYKDVGCLDNNRVILHLGPQPYIHANYVSTVNSPRRFICTQAPLPKTCGDFWHMIVQEKTDFIVMLCNFVEKGAKKCAEYYPTKPGPPLDFDNGEVIVKFLSQMPNFHLTYLLETKHQVTQTEVEVTVRGQPPHICKHYHWLDWPDRGVPEADLACISLLGKIKHTKTPIVVHCSAGIGRTGSIVLIQNAMELIFSNQPLLEMRIYVENLRLQRNNSIQTEHQYLYVHQVLMSYIRRSKFVEPALLPQFDTFAKEYLKATTGF